MAGRLLLVDQNEEVAAHLLDCTCWIAMRRHLGSSSGAWMRRHVNDKYVKAASEQDLRSRSAFKLIEMNNRYKFINASSRVVDLGSAPGGWSLALSEKVVKQSAGGRIVAVDLLSMAAIDGVGFIQGDFTEPEVQRRVRDLIPFIDVVISDALMNTTGHRDTDHLRSVELVESALEFAIGSMAHSPHPHSKAVLPTLLAKYYRGSEETQLLKRIRMAGYKDVRTIKPDASRKESREIYCLCRTDKCIAGETS